MISQLSAEITDDQKRASSKRLKALTLPQKQLFAHCTLPCCLTINYFRSLCGLVPCCVECVRTSGNPVRSKLRPISMAITTASWRYPEPADFEACGVYPAMDAVVAISTLLLGAIRQDWRRCHQYRQTVIENSGANYIEAHQWCRFSRWSIDDFYFLPGEVMEEENYKILCWKLSRRKSKKKRSRRNWSKVYAKTLSKRAYQISASASLNWWGALDNQATQTICLNNVSFLNNVFK